MSKNDVRSNVCFKISYNLLKADYIFCSPDFTMAYRSYLHFINLLYWRVLKIFNRISSICFVFGFVLAFCASYNFLNNINSCENYNLLVKQQHFQN
jgi:hypothetical protein